MSVKTFKAGQWMFTEGDTGYFIYWLLKGKVSIYESDEKINEVEVKKGDKPRLLGIIAAIQDDRRHTASVKTDTDIEVDEVYLDHVRGMVKNEVPAEIRKEIDTMIKAIVIGNRIKSMQRAFSALPSINLQIPGGVSKEVSEVLGELGGLYKLVMNESKAG